MKREFTNSDARLLCAGICAILLTAAAWAATSPARQVASDEKAKVKGMIVSRDGDLVAVNDKKSGSKTPVIQRLYASTARLSSSAIATWMSPLSCRA